MGLFVEVGFFVLVWLAFWGCVAAIIRCNLRNEKEIDRLRRKLNDMSKEGR